MVQNRSLKQVLNDLEKTYDVYFSFNPEEIKNARVSFDAGLNNIEQVLEDVLDETDLVFEKVEGQFYVIKKADSRFVNLNITEEDTGAPLPFATIRLQGTTLGQVADQNGNIKLVISKPRNTVLEISFLGFLTYELDISQVNSKEPIEIALKAQPLDLDEFEIKEYINVGIASDPKANSFKILPQEMEILPGLSERDVLLSAQIISGLTSNDESASGINVRGSSRDNTLLYWNDVPIYHTAHYFGNISSFIPSSIGSLDVYKNFIPVRYGGATSGLISLYSRNDIDAETKAEASINMTHADVYAKLPFKKDYGSFMIAARRSYNDLLPTPTFNSYTRKLFESRVVESTPMGRVLDDYDEEQAFSNDLSFSDINFQWNYKPSDRSDLSLSLINSDSRFLYIEDEIEDFENIELNHSIASFGANAHWNYRVSDAHALKTSLSYSTYDMAYSYTNRRNENVDFDDDEIRRGNTVNNLEFRINNTYRINEQSVTEFGYQMNQFDIFNDFSEDFFFEEDDTLNIDAQGGVHALYADYNYQPNENLELVLSARATHVGTLEETVFSPQLKLNYSVSDALILKSSYGIYHQYLSSLKETEFTLSNAVEQHWILSSNVNIPDEDEEETIRTIPVVINRQSSIGFLYNANSWLVDFDLYYKDVEGILARNQGFDVAPIQEYETGSEAIYGIDLTLRKRWKYWKAWFSYNYQDSEVQFSDELFERPFPSSLNINHQFRVSTTYGVGNWEFSLGYIFKSGLPFTNRSGVNLNQGDRDNDNDDDDDDFDFDPEQEFAELEYSNPNGDRLPNYHRVDVSIWHKLSLAQGKVNGEIGLSLMNILNRRNVFNRSYLIGFDQQDRPAIFERTKFFLDFTPNLSIRFWLQ